MKCQCRRHVSPRLLRDHPLPWTADCAVNEGPHFRALLGHTRRPCRDRRRSRCRRRSCRTGVSSGGGGRRDCWGSCCRRRRFRRCRRRGRWLPCRHKVRLFKIELSVNFFIRKMHGSKEYGQRARWDRRRVGIIERKHDKDSPGQARRQASI